MHFRSCPVNAFPPPLCGRERQRESTLHLKCWTLGERSLLHFVAINRWCTAPVHKSSQFPRWLKCNIDHRSYAAWTLSGDVPARLLAPPLITTNGRGVASCRYRGSEVMGPLLLILIFVLLSRVASCRRAIPLLLLASRSSCSCCPSFPCGSGSDLVRMP